MYIGQELPELTPVEIVGCEVCEAGSPLALDDGWFTECLLCGERKFVRREDMKKLDDYMEMVLYYFKYRECNPQVVELMIESFKMGSLTTV